MQCSRDSATTRKLFRHQMGLNDFQIHFERPNRTFFSGEVINGQVLINLSSEKKFRKIKLELVGSGRVHWTETRYEVS